MVMKRIPGGVEITSEAGEVASPALGLETWLEKPDFSIFIFSSVAVVDKTGLKGGTPTSWISLRALRRAATILSFPTPLPP
jgi:hypothetical protein